MQRTTALIQASLLGSTKEAGRGKMFLKGIRSGFRNAGKGPTPAQADYDGTLRQLADRYIIDHAAPYTYASEQLPAAKNYARKQMPAYRLGQSTAVPGALVGSGLLTGGMIGSTYGDTKGMKRMGNIAENVPLLERLRYIVDPDFLNDYITGKKPLPY